MDSKYKNGFSPKDDETNKKQTCITEYWLKNTINRFSISANDTTEKCNGLKPVTIFVTGIKLLSN